MGRTTLTKKFVTAVLFSSFDKFLATNSFDIYNKKFQYISFPFRQCPKIILDVLIGFPRPIKRKLCNTAIIGHQVGKIIRFNYLKKQLLIFLPVAFKLFEKLKTLRVLNEMKL